MAWQIPQSVTQAGTVADLGTTDDVFVASGVTIASTSGVTIRGTGNGHEALIYGTVVNSLTTAIFLGDSASADTGQTVTIKPGAQVHVFIVTAAINCIGTSSHVTNQGLIAAPTGFGIILDGVGAMTTSTIDNSGTIDAAFGVVRFATSTETIALQNSGLITGAAAAYYAFGVPNASDLITNTGTMVGGIILGGGNDVYNGAKGRLSGEVLGGDGGDVITGGTDNDDFFGEAGNDILTGNTGNDILNGGNGNDILCGVLGRDTMFGGADADRFDFNSIKESVKGGNRDQITDFQRGLDDIDLRTIDAKSGGGNQAFKFIGKQNFHDQKGELHYIDKGSKVIVQGDVNGDGKADFEIFVAVGSLSKGDFLL